MSKASIIDHLSNLLYSPENIQRASTYLASRGLDTSKFSFPWTATGEDVEYLKVLEPWIEASRFTESLFIPVCDLTVEGRLIGFDIRYVGSDPERGRFWKQKRDVSDEMIYCTHNIQDFPSDSPLLVCESAIDVESLRGLGHPVISFLTASSKERHLLLLLMLSNRIYFCYDNDLTGRNAFDKIKRNVLKMGDVSECFYPIVYSGKDPNQALCEKGFAYLTQMIQAQIQIHSKNVSDAKGFFTPEVKRILGSFSI